MREIKFRGKRLDNGEWIVGSYIEAENRDRSIAHQIIPYKAGLVVREVDPATVGQYTGLKDKNGKEIYEGDIIKTDFSYATWIGFVHFNKGNFELVDSDKNGQYLTLSVLSDIEIIGNIHDNPELLKGGDQ